VETDPTRMCELLVGLPEVRVLAVEDRCGEPIRVHVEQAGERPGCLGCGGAAKVKDRDLVELVDLPAFGRPARLMWHKVRWCCPDPDCEMRSWTWADPRIAGARVAMTDRAGRWATEQVGRYARSINEIAKELGCDWHTVNDAVIAYGTALVDDPGRIGAVEALGLDETLFARLGRFHRQHWSTSIVDVAAGQLLDVVPGRAGKATVAWLEAQGPTWRGGVRWATLDLSGPYKAVLDLMLPDATQIADPFHLVKLANSKLDETRRRVQSETLGHRGRKSDPLYRCRRLLTKADERLDEHGRTKLLGLLDAGDPAGEVRTAWHAKEVVRSIYDHHDPDLAEQFVGRLGHDLQDASCPPEVRSLGRTLLRWKDQIAAWHRAHVTQGPTEGINNLIKRVKRAAFGMTSFINFRIRVLLYAGKPNWDLLPAVSPR
jgi:transposase